MGGGVGGGLCSRRQCLRSHTLGASLPPPGRARPRHEHRPYWAVRAAVGGRGAVGRARAPRARRVPSTHAPHRPTSAPRGSIRLDPPRHPRRPLRPPANPDSCAHPQEEPAAAAPPPLDPATAATVARLAALAAPADAYEAEVAADAADLACSRGGIATPDALAAALAARGHAAAVRTVAGGGRGTECFDRLAHSFVVVLAPAGAGVARASALLGPGAPPAPSPIIVDAAFRDALTVAFPPAPLAAVLGALPSVWVGRASRLDAAVSAVAAATRAALAADGRPVPPWRSATALASKWAGTGRSVDVPPSAAAVAAAAAAGDDGACAAGCCHGCESPTGVLPNDHVASAWARVEAGWRAAERAAAEAKKTPLSPPPAVSQLSAALANVDGRVRRGMAVRTATWAPAA